MALALVAAPACSVLNAQAGRWTCCRAPHLLKDVAPGAQPPFLLYNKDLKTDTNKIEEFLEEALPPPE